MNRSRKIVFATNNAHKLEEIRSLLGEQWCVLSLDDIGCKEDIEETATTFQGNAQIKADFVKNRYGYDCFADDSGLMVDALDGAPGVYSARYAGDGHDSAANTAKLLENLEGEKNRGARFVTVIALRMGDDLRFFEGKIEGTISEHPAGNGGFGYDPVFVPEGHEESFAQMSSDEKNSISHRGRAVRKLIEYFDTLS